MPTSESSGPCTDVRTVNVKGSSPAISIVSVRRWNGTHFLPRL